MSTQRKSGRLVRLRQGPQTDRPVATGHGQEPAIGTEGRADHLASVSQSRCQRLARPPVPGPRLPIRADGHQALREIRALEQSRGTTRRSKIIMTTALVDQKNVMNAIRAQCDYFLAKPIRKTALLDQLRVLSLIA